MDGARADDYEKPAVLVAALDNLNRLIAALQNGFSRLGRLGDLALKKIWRRERVVAADAPIF